VAATFYDPGVGWGSGGGGVAGGGGRGGAVVGEGERRDGLRGGCERGGVAALPGVGGCVCPVGAGLNSVCGRPSDRGSGAQRAGGGSGGVYAVRPPVARGGGGRG